LIIAFKLEFLVRHSHLDSKEGRIFAGKYSFTITLVLYSPIVAAGLPDFLLQEEIKRLVAKVVFTMTSYPLGVFFLMEFLLDHLEVAIDQEAHPSE